MRRLQNPLSSKTGLLFLCLTLLLGACSKEKPTDPEAGDSETDTDVDIGDTRGPTNDTRLDTLSDSIDDTGDISMDTSDGSSESLLSRITGSPGQGIDFHQISNHWAVRSLSGRGPDRKQTFLVLYDISDSQSIVVADHIAFDVSRIESAFDGESIFLAGQGRDSSWIKRFEIEAGELSEQESFTGGLDSDNPLDSSLFDMVTNGSETYVILDDSFLQIGSATLGLGIARRVDRRKEMEELKLTSNFQTDKYQLTPDGLILQATRDPNYDFVFWNTKKDPQSGELVAGLFTSDRFKSGSVSNWTYSASTEMIYGFSVAENNTPTSYDLLTALDISDPTAPEVVGRWSLENEFSKSAYNYGSIFVRSGRVYFAAPPNLFVVRDSADPEKITEMAIIDSDDIQFPNPNLWTRFGNIAVTADSLFVRYGPADLQPTFPEVPLVRVPLSELPTK